MQERTSSDIQNWGFLHVLVLFISFILLAGVFIYTGLGYVNGPIKVNWSQTILIITVWNIVVISIYARMGQMLSNLGFFNKKQKYVWGGIVSIFWIGLINYIVLDRLLLYSKPNAFSIDGNFIQPNGFQEALLLVPPFCIPWLFEVVVTWILVRKRFQVHLLKCLGQWAMIVAAIFVIASVFHIYILTIGLILVGIGIFHSNILQYLLRQQQELAFEKS